MSKTVAVLDLFTGAGGLTLGWHKAADQAEIVTKVVGSVELDEAAAATYAQNFGNEHQFIGPIEEWLDTVETPLADVILGGPPCQGFSTLGKKDINDVRNILWKRYADTIVRAHPKYFVVENVVPFLRSSEYVALQRSTEPGGILSNYVLETHQLIAADYGTPQKRRRAIVIGRHRDLPEVGAPVKTIYDPKDWSKVGDAFADIPDQVDGRLLPNRISESGLPGPYTTRELHLGRKYRELSLKRFAKIPPGGNRFDIPDRLLAPCWRKSPTGFSDVMGRLRAHEPSVTIRTEFDKPEKGRYLHPSENRAITHFEAARLQGFPDDFEWIGSKPTIARQIGNAVPVQLATAISKSILSAMAALEDHNIETHRAEFSLGADAV